MKNLITRSLTGAAFAIILIGCVVLGQISFYILSLTILSIGLYEFYGLTHFERTQPNIILGITTGITIFTVHFLRKAGYIDDTLYLLIPFFVWMIFIIELYRNHKKPFPNIASTLFGIIYIVLPFTLGINLVFSPLTGEFYSFHIFLGVLILLWMNDTGAYCFGMLLGRHRLFLRISPKKSWEGAIGGLLTAIGTSMVLSRYFPELDFKDWIIIAVIIVLFGNMGDLIESMFKRSIKIKDSGKILPGHGGILDRFDSLLLALPFIFIYLELKIRLAL